MCDKNMFCRPSKLQSFDNKIPKFTHPLGNVLAPLRKYLKGSKVSNAYEHFVFCSFQNHNEWLEINRRIYDGYRLWSFTICRGIKENYEQLYSRLVLNIIALLRTPDSKKQLVALNNVNTAVATPWAKFEISFTRKGLQVVQTIMRRVSYTQNEWRYLPTAGVSYLAHVKVHQGKKARS